MDHFRIYDDEHPQVIEEKHYDYPSDCLDFVKLNVGNTVKYMSVARESEAYSIPVWVAEPKRVAVLDDMAELTYDNLAGAFAV